MFLCFSTSGSSMNSLAELCVQWSTDEIDQMFPFEFSHNVWQSSFKPTVSWLKDGVGNQRVNWEDKQERNTSLSLLSLLSFLSPCLFRVTVVPALRASVSGVLDGVQRCRVNSALSGPREESFSLDPFRFRGRIRDLLDLLYCNKIHKIKINNNKSGVWKKSKYRHLHFLE